MSLPDPTLATPTDPFPPHADHLFCDGRAIWYIRNLWPLAAGLEPFDLPIDSIKELDQPCWFGGDQHGSAVWNKPPTCRAVIQHALRMARADLRHPIILAPAPSTDILDGLHRVGRALMEGRTTIRAVRLPAMPPPDELLPVGDPRCSA